MGDAGTGFLVEHDARTDPVSSEDAAWIAMQFETFNRLASKSEPFRLALEAAIDWRYAKEPRLVVSRIWSGIEAVFGVTSELVYRISILSASQLARRKGRATEDEGFRPRRDSIASGARLFTANPCRRRLSCQR